MFTPRILPIQFFQKQLPQASTRFLVEMTITTLPQPTDLVDLSHMRMVLSRMSNDVLCQLLVGLILREQIGVPSFELKGSLTLTSSLETMKHLGVVCTRFNGATERSGVDFANNLDNMDQWAIELIIVERTDMNTVSPPTPRMAQNTNIARPAGDLGYKSPYPTVVYVIKPGVRPARQYRSNREPAGTAPSTNRNRGHSRKSILQSS